jgi:hypothetical protein
MAMPSRHGCKNVRTCEIYHPSPNAAHLAIRLPHPKHFRERKVFCLAQSASKQAEAVSRVDGTRHWSWCICR